ncbi:hypothetical protein HNQ08_002609 [Deinococcus humi]|uniref:Uncharacterized protein n=2 Tax=Deinococcus humi TaxID=662880 RepID=A0A7W8JVC7_9DEIO|nr:hypothetical protein [Deinococcus humi]GGO30490.1 hypothetical protein GCM10008949_25400 [Deinococcus humi]
MLAPRFSERAAYQEDWRDLCALLGEPTPSSALSGEDYAFEKHVKEMGTGETGFADVFKRNHFTVEYRGQGHCGSSRRPNVRSYAQANPKAPTRPTRCGAYPALHRRLR